LRFENRREKMIIKDKERRKQKSELKETRLASNI
jgi:hypothetical protein